MFWVQLWTDGKYCTIICHTITECVLSLRPLQSAGPFRLPVITRNKPTTTFQTCGSKMWTYVLRFPSPAAFASGSAVAAAGLAALASFTSAASSGRCEDPAVVVDAATTAPPPKPALNPAEFRPFRVRSVETVTHNTKRITFDLASPDQEMGLQVASCLLARAKVDGKSVVRPYTPTNLNEQRGYLELVIKGYPAGKLSKHMVELQPGDEVEMRGPLAKFAYTPNKVKKMGLIAGGSGITPMLQIAKHICRDPTDMTEVTLLYANVTEDDIILRHELDALQYLYPQFKVFYVLDKPPADWQGYSGYITKEMIQETMPSPSDDHLICVCGPPPMMYHVSGNKATDNSQGELQGLLNALNYKYTQVFKF